MVRRFRSLPVLHDRPECGGIPSKPHVGLDECAATAILTQNSLGIPAPHSRQAHCAARIRVGAGRFGRAAGQSDRVFGPQGRTSLASGRDRKLMARTGATEATALYSKWESRGICKLAAKQLPSPNYYAARE
jgi:hypothetical protein